MPGTVIHDANDIYSHIPLVHHFSLFFFSFLSLHKSQRNFIAGRSTHDLVCRSRETRVPLSFSTCDTVFSFTSKSLNYVFHADSVAYNSLAFFFSLEQRTRDPTRNSIRPSCAAREHELTRRAETRRGRSAGFTEPLFGRYTPAPPPGLHPYRPFSSIASFPLLPEIFATVAR